MSALELRIPPPVVMLLVGAVMWLLSICVPGLAVVIPIRGAIAGVLLAAGGATALAGVHAFRRFRTTVNPMRPESTISLVTSGIYRYTRNPMYLGLLLVVTAWACWLSNVLVFLLLPVFVAYITRFQILPEERALAARFGEEFAAYCRRVRRWV